MKILFLTVALQYSGAQKMMAQVANWLAEAGEEVAITTYFSPEITQKLDERIKTDCMHVKRGGGAKELLKDYFVFRKRIVNYVLNQKADVVITFGDLFSTMALAELKRKGQCVIVCERADPGGTDLISRYRRVAFKKASGYVFQTEGAKDCFCKDIQDRGYVIPNPVIVSHSECLPFEARKKKIVSVGRLEFKQKRQDLLLEAFEYVHKKHPDYELYCYGDGPDLERARQMAKESDASEKIFLPGAVSPIEEYIKDASLSVLSSDFEGIPNAVIEAMNMKIPVVSTDCSPGGARLLLGEDEFGLVVPCGNAEALAEKMIYAIEHKEEMQAKSIGAKESLKRFRPEIISEMWKKSIYEIKKRGSE